MSGGTSYAAGRCPPGSFAPSQCPLRWHTSKSRSPTRRDKSLLSATYFEDLSLRRSLRALPSNSSGKASHSSPRASVRYSASARPHARHSTSSKPLQPSSTHTTAAVPHSLHSVSSKASLGVTLKHTGCTPTRRSQCLCLKGRPHARIRSTLFEVPPSLQT